MKKDNDEKYELLSLNHCVNGRAVVLDTETTGLNYKEGEKIIEIGCVETYNGRITGSVYQIYINPMKNVSLGAFKVHGISNEFLKDKPTFDKIAQDLIEFLGDAPLVIHNSKFDVPFLNHELHLCGLPPLKNAVVDTLLIARKLYPGKKCSLDALCKKLNIDNSVRTLHGALLDAHILAKVYFALQHNGVQESFTSEKFAEDSEIRQKNANLKLETIRLHREKLSFQLISPEDRKKHQEIMESLKK